MNIKFSFFCSYFLVWLLLTGLDLSAINLCYAFFTTLITIAIAESLKLLPDKNIFNKHSIFYFQWLCKEIFLSALNIIKLSWQRNINTTPKIEKITTSLNSELSNVLLANSITITPGTLTIDINKSYLLIHSIDKEVMKSLQNSNIEEKVNKITNY